MEHISREITYPQLDSRPPRFRLSPFVSVLFALWLGLAVLMLTVRAAAQYSAAPSNPFPAYNDVLPGQPASAAEARAESCWGNYNFYHRPTQDQYSGEESCNLIVSAGVFSRVEARIFQGSIQSISFTLSDNTFQIGDLEMFLKMSALHTLQCTAYFYFPDNFVVAETTGYAKQFSLFLPVQRITFTDIKFLNSE